MKNRYGIIFTSSSILSDTCEAPNSHTLRNYSNEIKEALASLGKYSFTWPNKSGEPLVLKHTATYADFLKKLDKLPPPEANRSSTILLYYMGHGITEDRQFYLAFKGIKQVPRDPDLSINSVVQKLRRKGFAKIILILDCCHAGYVMQNLNESIPNYNSYYAMVSTNLGQTFDFEFTDTLLKVIKDSKMREGLRSAVRGGSITLSDWFSAAKKLLPPEHESMDFGGLSSYKLMSINLEPPDQFNLKANKKSLYYKIFELLNIIGPKEKKLDNIIRSIHIGHPSFTITVIKNNTVSQQLISEHTISHYLDIAIKLGCLSKQDDKYQLTTNCKLSLMNDGATLNRFIYNGVFNILPKALNFQVFNNMLCQLVREGRMPTINRIEREIMKHNIVINKTDLKIALKLLGYTGAIEIANKETYFPI